MWKRCGNRLRTLKRNCSTPPSMLLTVKKVTQPLLHTLLALLIFGLSVADTLQRGKIKNKVLKLTGLSQVRKIDVSCPVSSRFAMAKRRLILLSLQRPKPLERILVQLKLNLTTP